MPNTDKTTDSMLHLCATIDYVRGVHNLWCYSLIYSRQTNEEEISLYQWTTAHKCIHIAGKNKGCTGYARLERKHTSSQNKQSSDLENSLGTRQLRAWDEANIIILRQCERLRCVATRAATTSIL